MTKRFYSTVASKSWLISDGVRARYLRNENKRWELVISMDSDLSIERIRSAWVDIATARERLHRLQGSDFNQVILALRTSHAAMRFREGFTYGGIALHINYQCLVQLCRALQFLEQNLPEEAFKCEATCFAMLKSVRVKDNNAWDWIESAMREIKRGSAPFRLDGGPVDALRVRDCLRQFSKEFKSQKVIFRKPADTEMVAPDALQAPDTDPATVLARNLLQNEPDNGGLDKLDEAYQRYIQVRVENSG